MNKTSYETLIRHAMEMNASIGFDSCGANKFLEAIKDHPRYDQISQSVEPCESGLFSAYINERGVYYPCSFMEGLETGIYVDDEKVGNFMDIWDGEVVREWRGRLLKCGRSCPMYDI